MTIAEFVKTERHNLKMTQVKFATEVNASVLSILSQCRTDIFEKNSAHVVSRTLFVPLPVI